MKISKNFCISSLSYQLGYANKMNIYELNKLINDYDKRFISNLKKFDEEFNNASFFNDYDDYSKYESSFWSFFCYFFY